jgi:phenylpropionate dioxygenase-like ring-hydroxylating dioxygenase large terminal subunit
VTPPDDDLDEAPSYRSDASPTIAVRGLTRGRVSVVHPRSWWYIVASSDDLRDQPVARTLLGLPIVLFRDGEGRAAALLDRCAHRNVPLSGGVVHRGEMQCPYHGWRFDAEGVCRHIPSLVGDCAAKARNVPRFATRELDGFVWVFAAPGETSTREPYRFTLLGAPGYDNVRQVVEAPGTLHATIENALDVPHTQFLHRGLFRGESRGITIEAIVQRRSDRVEAEYVGEPRPQGVVGKLLSPSGGVVRHVDRFLLPSIAEVEYRLGDENHLLVASAMTPVSDFVTRLYTVVSFRLRVPHALVKAMLTPLAMRIFAQDAAILATQTDTVRRFGGEQFASSEIDVLGRHIWRLLRAAERGDVAESNAVLGEERVILVV